MLVCNVSLRPPRAGLTAEIVEVATALDAPGTGNVVFATLVDDPASVLDIVDAYLGEIMLEAASAGAVVDASVPTVYAADIVETATAAAAQDGTAAADPFARDGTPTASTSTSGVSATVTSPTTSYANDVLVLFTCHNSSGASITSITDTSGKTATWQLRKIIGSTALRLEEWYTTTTGTISGATITVNFSGAITFTSLSCVAISGANISSPYDTNVGLPVSTTGIGSDPLSCNTTASDTIAIAGFRMQTTPSPTAGSGWTQDKGQDYLLVEHKTNTSPQTGLSATIGTGSGNSNAGILDAIRKA